MNGNVATPYRPPPSIDAMVDAFTEHCYDGGADFVEHLKDWHMSDALGVINDAAQNYAPQAAITIIKKALAELIEIGAQGHRDKLEWEGVE